jgi:hypothetical protein
LIDVTDLETLNYFLTNFCGMGIGVLEAIGARYVLRTGGVTAGFSVIVGFY